MKNLLLLVVIVMSFVVFTSCEEDYETPNIVYDDKPLEAGNQVNRAWLTQYDLAESKIFRGCIYSDQVIDDMTVYRSDCGSWHTVKIHAYWGIKNYVPNLSELKFFMYISPSMHEALSEQLKINKTLIVYVSDNQSLPNGITGKSITGWE